MLSCKKFKQGYKVHRFLRYKRSETLSSSRIEKLKYITIYIKYFNREQDLSSNNKDMSHIKFVT